MNNIDKLQEEVKKIFEGAEDKKTIEQSVTLNNIISDIKSDQEQSQKEYKELLASYQDAIRHTAFKDAPKNEVDSQPVDLNSIVQRVAKEK